MDDWTRVKISCTPEQVELVSAIAMMVDSHIMVEDNSDIEQYNSMYGELIDESLKSCEDTSVSVFVPKERDLAQAMAFLRERLDAAGLSVTVSAEGLHEEDWADNWKQYYHPVRVGEHIVIVPEWEMETFEPREGDVVVMMDPGMAFGTGTHETTRLCAALMEDTVERGSRITDVGTGSGILAIIAAKLGARCTREYRKERLRRPHFLQRVGSARVGTRRGGYDNRKYNRGYHPAHGTLCAALRAPRRSRRFVGYN